MTDMILPDHPGLEHFNMENLKQQCPAFASGCPYAKMEEAKFVTVSKGQLDNCPAFKEGCPFARKTEEEIKHLKNTIPRNHAGLNLTEIPSCKEGIELVKLLNKFLSERQELELDIEMTEQDDSDIEQALLEDPELALSLRNGTKTIHKAAISSMFTKRFLKGEINREEYAHYVRSFYFVYSTMESLLEKHKDNPVIQLVHFPEELNRGGGLLKDIEFYYGKDRVAEMTEAASMPPAVRNYVERMQQLCEEDPTLLVAHSYSRYLGDLSGGQLLAKRVKRHVLKLDAYSAEWDTDAGLLFYSFTNLGNQMEFKELYRERLNAAKVDIKTRDRIVDEAIHAFELNIALFDEIHELSVNDQLPRTAEDALANTNSSSASQSMSQKYLTPSFTIPTIWAVTGAVTLAAAASIAYHRFKRA